MALNHGVLFRKLEELEAQVRVQLQTPIELPLHGLAVYQIRRKADFIKTLLAAETESSTRSKNPGDLQVIADRLSTVEEDFINWVTSGRVCTELNPRDEPTIPEEISERLSFVENNFEELGSSEAGDGAIEGPLHPILCQYCQEEEEEEEADDQDEVEDMKTMAFRVTEEKMRGDLEAMVSKVNIEKIVRELTTERLREMESRRGCWWLRRIGTIGAAVVLAAVGLAMTGFGSGEESVFLVPT